MNPLLVIGIVWLLFGLWRGYTQGFIKVLASLAAMLLGYVACFMWGWPLAQKLTGVVSPVWQWPLAAGAIFIVTTVACRLIAWPLGYVFGQDPLGRLLGSLLNGAISLVMLLVLVWSLGFLAGNGQAGALHQVLAQLGYSATHPMVMASQWLVSRSVYWGVKIAGANDDQAYTAAKVSLTPAKTLQQLQQVVQSPMTRDLVASPSLSEAVASGNARVLQQTPEFTAFTQQQGMGDVMALLPKNAGQTPELALADAMILVWQKVEEIKKSPEVQAALADPEIQALMQKGDNLTLMRHPKMQPILGAVMAAVNGSNRALVESVPTPLIDQIKNALPDDLIDRVDTNNSQDVMYKWLDDLGKTHYSTWDKIPKANRDGAELMNL